MSNHENQPKSLNPILLELPVPIVTQRLILRPPSPGEGQDCNNAIQESFKTLRQWMPWAQKLPQVTETEEVARRAAAKWLLRDDLMLWMWDKATGKFIGGTGFHDIDWQVPRLQIGYWIRDSASGKGLMTEAVEALTNYAFKAIKAKRIEIRCDKNNAKSRKIPERLGYKLEGILEKNEIVPDGSLRDTCIYARLSPE